MTAESNTTITQDERLISLFAHLSILFGGILLPLIFWLIQKDKSKFVSFNALQALWFQLSYTVFTIIYVVLIFIVSIFLGGGLSLMSSPKGELPAIIVMIIIISLGLIFLTVFVAIAYSVYVGIKSYQGELAKYPFIGNAVYKRVYG